MQKPYTQDSSGSWRNRRSLEISFLSLAVACFSVYFSWKQINDFEKTAHFNVTPNISCTMRFPLNFKSTYSPKQDRNPEVQFLNQGPIKVVSFSVLHEMFTFDPKNGDLLAWSGTKQEQHEYIVFESDLEVAIAKKEPLLATTGLGVYVFYLSYYRESDMQRFTKREIFLVEGSNILDHNKFKSHPLYKKILMRLELFTDPDSTLSKRNLLK